MFYIALVHEPIKCFDSMFCISCSDKKVNNFTALPII